MALTAILYDFQIALSNVDRKVEEGLSFKLARHPSELMERSWLKVMAYCWLWEDRLNFGPGLSDPDAPDLETRRVVGKGTPVSFRDCPAAVNRNESRQLEALGAMGVPGKRRQVGALQFEVNPEGRVHRQPRARL